MRTGLGILAVLAGLGLAAPARAQSQASTFFTGVNPHNIQNKPIDVSKAFKAFNGNNLVKTVPTKTFDLSRIFHPFSGPTFPPKVGHSNFPASTVKRPGKNIAPGAAGQK